MKQRKAWDLGFDLGYSNKVPTRQDSKKAIQQHPLAYASGIRTGAYARSKTHD
jgi:hypothetical protein